MPKPSNYPDRLHAIRQSLQAREILQNLEAMGGSSNDAVFYHWLGDIGLGIARQCLSELLDRLERENLIATEKVAQYRVLRITHQGQEVATGLISIEWIARLEPKA